jgi:hypothetical protein
MDAERVQGKREVNPHQSEEDIKSSKIRSKRRVRHLVKSMGCDRLLTLTVRETAETGFMTIGQIVTAWDGFNRLLKKAGSQIEYVAVPERHEKGNYHIHAAICGYANVKLLRRCWLAALKGYGRTGNVDIARRSDISPIERRARLAKYVSKYITKAFDVVEFNKKRYWASRHKLPSERRYVLAAESAEDAMREVCEIFSLKYSDVYASGSGKAVVVGVMASAYRFPSGDGFWLNYTDDIAKDCPF